MHHPQLAVASLLVVDVPEVRAHRILDKAVRRFIGVREAFGPIDILVNYVSGGAWKGLQEISPDEFEQARRVAAYGGSVPRSLPFGA